MEDYAQTSSSGSQIDPYRIDEEKDKWMKRSQFGVVIVVRIIVAGLIFVLKMFKAVLMEIARTFKLIS